MALSGSAVLAIWNGIRPEAEDAFVTWHVQEHIPERVGLPGFRRGRRYVAVNGHPKYFNFYETEDLATLSSPTYVSRLNAPTPWTREVVSNFTDTSRTACTVAMSKGQGDGAAIMTFRLDTDAGQDTFVANIEAAAAKLLGLPGIVGVHLLEGDTATGAQATAEKALRDRPDEVAPWILLIEGVDADRLAALENTASLSATLSSAGAASDMRMGIYALQFSLAENQITTSSV